MLWYIKKGLIGESYRALFGGILREKTAVWKFSIIIIHILKVVISQYGGTLGR
jgi:hypothetical protein